jgi:hypothetical protein
MLIGGGAFPWHPRSLPLGEVLALPEDSGQRVELVDGMLTVSPAPRPRRQRVLARLDFDSLYIDAADVVLVLEVVSPSSRTHDRVLERQLRLDEPFAVEVGFEQPLR